MRRIGKAYQIKPRNRPRSHVIEIELPHTWPALCNSTKKRVECSQAAGTLFVLFTRARDTFRPFVRVREKNSSTRGYE